MRSTVGKGSIFTFTIKAMKVMKPEKKRKHDSITAFNKDIKKLKVLIVDDETSVLEYFVDVMMRLGVICETASNGEAALEMIGKNGKYDICFIDWLMPSMDGFELTERIKKTNGEKTIVVMISAMDRETIEADARYSSVDDFIPKPIFPSSIVDCIHKAIGSELLDSASKEERAKTSVFENRCVMLAEDVDVNREIMLALLEPTQLKIDCAENGVEAVRKFSQAPDSYDLIFMDVQMPEMDGYEATRLIRETDAEKAKTIPIIALTANVFTEDIKKCIEAGMNDHIGKPINLDEVMEKLKKYLT